MTDGWLWALISALVLLVVGTGLKAAQEAFTLKQAEKKIASLEAEIERLKKQHQETIASIEQRSTAATAKAAERIDDLESQARFQSQAPLKYPRSGVA